MGHGAGTGLHGPGRFNPKTPAGKDGTGEQGLQVNVHLVTTHERESRSVKRRRIEARGQTRAMAVEGTVQGTVRGMGQAVAAAAAVATRHKEGPAPHRSTTDGRAADR